MSHRPPGDRRRRARLTFGPPTSEILAQVLEDAGLTELAANARRKDYDDYESTVTTDNIELLVTHLRDAGREDLAARAMGGEWDGTTAESEAWRRSTEGRETFAELTGTPKESPLRPRSDPRRASGGEVVTVDEDPFSVDTSVVDTTNAVLLGDVGVVLVGTPGSPDPIAGLQLSGRINKTPDEVSILYLLDADGVAAVVTELIALAQRGQFGKEIAVAIDRRMAAMPKPGGAQ